LKPESDFKVVGSYHLFVPNFHGWNEGGKVKDQVGLNVIFSNHQAFRRRNTLVLANRRNPAGSQNKQHLARIQGADGA